MRIRRTALLDPAAAQPRSQRTGTRADDGLTAVELLVAGLVGLMLVISMTTVLLMVTRVTSESVVHATNSRQLRSTAEIIGSSLRVGVAPEGEPAAVVVAKPGEIVFYALLHRSGVPAVNEVIPTQVRLWWNPVDRCLTQERTAGQLLGSVAPDGSIYGWSAVPDRRCLMVTSTPPTFRYFDTAQTTVNGTLVADLGAPPWGLNQSTLPSIRSVEIHLVSQDPKRLSVAGSVATDRITLSNVA